MVPNGSAMAAVAPFVSASVGSVMVSNPTVSGAGVAFTDAVVVLAGPAAALDGDTAALKVPVVAFFSAAAVATFVGASVGSAAVDASVLAVAMVAAAGKAVARRLNDAVGIRSGDFFDLAAWPGTLRGARGLLARARLSCLAIILMHSMLRR